jgi:hypothetical protein
LACATYRENQVWARGQEYDRVYIDLDVAASLSRPEALLTSALGDEANIAYVGFTRAIHELHLPRDFKTILTPEWQDTIERYEPTQVARISKASLAKKFLSPAWGEAR